MTQVRYLLMGLCGWLFMLYNVERLAAPANIASFVYIITFVTAILLLFAPRLCWFAFHWLFLAAVVPFFLLKSLLNYEILGANWPITIVELSAIALTIGLVQLIGRRFDKLQTLLTSLTIGPIDSDVRSFSTGQSQIYREIRRARQFDRPASLLAISTVASPVDPTQNPLLQDSYLRRFLEDIQRETLKKHIATRLANLLVAELGDSAVVTQRNGHFVTLLPETDREQLNSVVQKLQTSAEESLGLKLHIGVSTFPDEAVTFESMLEHAETEMTGATPSQHMIKKTPFAGQHRDATQQVAEHRVSDPVEEPSLAEQQTEQQPTRLTPTGDYHQGEHREMLNISVNGVR